MQKLIIFLLFFSILVSNSSVFVFAQSDNEAEKAKLEAELKALEREIAEANRNITATEAEKQTLQHQINRLQNEISTLTTQINRNRVVIQNLGLKIADTQGSIAVTNQKIEKSKEELSEMLRTLNSEGRTSILEIMLTEDNLSSAFTSINSLETLSIETKNILDNVKALKRSLEGQKAGLESDRSETERVAKIQEAQKAQEEAARAERRRLYGLTEAEYQKQVSEKKELERQADAIRKRLFELVGLPPDVAVPTFEEAYRIAQWVSGVTGVRPAFILSIIQQESALGRNVGQCYLADTTTGASVNINSGQRYSNGIHPTRDIPPFLTITKELNRDPLKTRISCPLSYGYGGAMGPAQFIPSTWQMVRSEVRGILGHEPDPWRIRDSFMASGVLLKRNGGTPPSRQNEWNAAMRYFSGGTTNSKFFWYADQVINRADQFERDIEIMTKN